MLRVKGNVYVCYLIKIILYLFLFFLQWKNAINLVI
jgi:hypothetical protein